MTPNARTANEIGANFLYSLGPQSAMSSKTLNGIKQDNSIISQIIAKIFYSRCEGNDSGRSHNLNISIFRVINIFRNNNFQKNFMRL